VPCGLTRDDFADRKQKSSCKSTVVLCLQPPESSSCQRNSHGDDAMSLYLSRAVARPHQLLFRRAALRSQSTASEAASKAKETAEQAASKAASGLSRVQSSAGSALSTVGSAAGSAVNAIGSIGGPIGRLVGFVQCECCPHGSNMATSIRGRNYM